MKYALGIACAAVFAFAQPLRSASDRVPTSIHAGSRFVVVDEGPLNGNEFDVESVDGPWLLCRRSPAQLERDARALMPGGDTPAKVAANLRSEAKALRDKAAGWLNKGNAPAEDAKDAIREAEAKEELARSVDLTLASLTKENESKILMVNASAVSALSAAR